MNDSLPINETFRRRQKPRSVTLVTATSIFRRWKKKKNRRASDEPDETTKPRRDTRVVVSSGNTPADLNYSMNVPVHSLCRARDAQCFPFPRGEQSRARKARLGEPNQMDGFLSRRKRDKALALATQSLTPTAARCR